MDTIKKRILSIDVLRGIIMAIMALDHTRDYFHLDAVTQDPTNLTTTTPILFFTRFITHYCAPTFVFLSGLSIYLQSLRKNKPELSKFLLTRGLWLVIMELTFVNFGWSFNIYFNFAFLQVIWAIGWSMIFLAALIRLPYPAIVVTALSITLLHNLTDIYKPINEELYVASNFLMFTDFTLYHIGPVNIISAYAILPWTGVMLLGYSTGKWFESERVSPEKRQRLLIISGLSLIVLFVVLRLINGYGDPSPWKPQKDSVYTLLSILNITKYPPSLMYVCITLGPSLLVLAALENVQVKGFWKVMNTFGRVPFFYYLLHVYIIHLLCVVVYFAQGYTLGQLFTIPQQFAFRPNENFGFSLGYVYLMWLLVLVLCYFPSRWYDRYKTANKKWWLSYL
ncbi:DUF1624 domain-containing protein [Flavobacterium sp. RHBU_3]|uniref:DUF1624 domain-containing protein n=1 Tax=Flavobacterium sp. RHBU_3 TaxID=3391184 RepID=UPI003985021D